MDERIIALANELVRELIRAGYDLRTTAHPDDYSSFDIDIWDNKRIQVRHICREWKVEGAYQPAQPEKGE